MKNLVLFFKGFILGVANIIPGVSGGTLAITLGIYEDIIKAISHFFSNFKKNIKFLLPIALGAVVSILLLSKVISFSLEKAPVATTLFFIGLIVGGLPLIFKKIEGKKVKKSYIISFIVPMVIVLGLTFISSGNNYINLTNFNPLMILILFIVGVVASATMIIPGISGSFVLMLLGFYKPIVKTVSNLTNLNMFGHNMLVLIPFGIGVLVGIVLIAKLIEYLLKKHETSTYYAIIGFIILSIASLIIGLFAYKLNVVELLVGVLMFMIGSLIGYKLGDK